MKKYIILISFSCNLLFFTTTVPCPCEINTDDPQPFFLQESDELHNNDDEHNNDDSVKCNDTTQKL